MFSLDLNEEQSHILRNLCQGSFYPVTEYMGEATISSVAARMRLTDGSIFPMPIFLDVPSEFAVKIKIGTVINLRHKHIKLAELRVRDKFKLDKANLVFQLFGTDSREHPGVKKFFDLGDFAVEGSLSFMLEQEERLHTPMIVREHIKRMG